MCREPTANDFHPLPQQQHALLAAEQLQTNLFLSRGFSHHAQRTKAIPEGAGKRIRAQRAGTAPSPTPSPLKHAPSPILLIVARMVPHPLV